MSRKPNLRVVGGDDLNRTVNLQLGGGWTIRVYGFSDLSPPLVEMRGSIFNSPVNLTINQAEIIGRGLLAAVEKARGT